MICVLYTYTIHEPAVVASHKIYHAENIKLAKEYIKRRFGHDVSCIINNKNVAHDESHKHTYEKDFSFAYQEYRESGVLISEEFKIIHPNEIINGHNGPHLKI